MTDYTHDNTSNNICNNPDSAYHGAPLGQLDPITIKPAPGYILLEQLQQKKETGSGIVLTASLNYTENTARVFAVSDGYNDCAVGDIIVVDRFVGEQLTGIPREFGIYRIVKTSDIMAVLYG